jgi:hypothetical protein
MPEYAPIEILLVEDNPTDLELALHALQRHHLANRVHVARRRHAGATGHTARSMSYSRSEVPFNQATP